MCFECCLVLQLDVDSGIVYQVDTKFITVYNIYMYICISIYNTYTFSLSLQAVKLAKYPTLYARAAL